MHKGKPVGSGEPLLWLGGVTGGSGSGLAGSGPRAGVSRSGSRGLRTGVSSAVGFDMGFTPQLLFARLVTACEREAPPARAGYLEMFLSATYTAPGVAAL
jgi:hypothetical protein